MFGALEETQMGYEVVVEGHNDSRSEMLRRWTGRLSQHSSASVAATQKLFLYSQSEVRHGKTSIHHNGFVTQSTVH